MTCAGHGTAMPPRPSFYPDGTCWQCHKKYPPPFVPPPPKDCPANFVPGATQDGVTRNASGHIIGITWGELKGANAHLINFKDRAIGPGHPLAEGMDPRSFIPSAARARSPPRPSQSPRQAAAAQPELPPRQAAQPCADAGAAPVGQAAAQPEGETGAEPAARGEAP
jgi:hypothetical protein